MRFPCSRKGDFCPAGESGGEEVRQAAVEQTPVGPLADAMAFVLEGQHLMGHPGRFQSALHDGQILRRHIGIAHALDDRAAGP